MQVQRTPGHQFQTLLHAGYIRDRDNGDYTYLVPTTTTRSSLPTSFGQYHTPERAALAVSWLFGYFGNFISTRSLAEKIAKGNMIAIVTSLSTIIANQPCYSSTTKERLLLTFTCVTTKERAGT